MSDSEVKLWLKTALKEENIEDYSVTVEGTSEKGDGYSGDIIFATLLPVRNDNRLKNYNLALKCSKPTDAVAQNIRVDEAYLNEGYMYGTIFPEFVQFQLEKGISDYFNSVPKFYGTVSAGNREVIVLENLKKLDYSLWNKKKPLTRKHIEMVLSEYAKFHALSIAMNDQKPQKFEKLTSGVINFFQNFLEACGVEKNFMIAVDEVYDVLQGEVDETILEKWRELKTKISYIFGDMLKGMDGPKVILHGDSWCNNFLFKHVVNDENTPLNVAILDWQMSRVSSPIVDLSYFIFSSISKKDIEFLDAILQHYHSSLKSFLGRLGSNLDLLYPYNQFFNDWKKYCKYGIVTSCVILKICSSDKDEVVDITENEDINDSFSFNVRNNSCFKDRTKHIVEYVVENELI